MNLTSEDMKSGARFHNFLALPAVHDGKMPCSAALSTLPSSEAYARRIAGGRTSCTAHAGFLLDAPDQVLHDRRLVHRGIIALGAANTSLSNRPSGLAEAGIEPSVGSVGASYDNALAETINGLYRAEAIHRRGPWGSFEAVEFATLEWVDWFNNRRLLEPIGNIPLPEAVQRYYAMLEQSAMASQLIGLQQTRGGSRCQGRSLLRERLCCLLDRYCSSTILAKSEHAPFPERGPLFRLQPR